VSTQIARLLLEWYAHHQRTLPWRNHPDPYAVWVSEIMLQQTQVDAVIPYFERWMKRFPSLEVLATAPQQEVLSAWEGLGYYSRARNLHRAAQKVIAEYGGVIPQDARTLQTLPGIGRYTAGSIASIAFQKDEPALDGNIRRVFTRLFDVQEPARSPKSEKLLWKLVTEHLPAGKAGDYNQAIMDLGATICTPRSPACRLCPLTELCQARSLGVQEQRPVMKKKAEIPHITVAAAIIGRPHQVLIAQRPQHGLLGGMWEFPGGKRQDGEELTACLKREIGEELGVVIEVGEAFGIYRHAYTHFRVTLHAFRCSILEGVPQPLEASEIAWVTPTELSDYPMGKIDRQIAKHLTAEMNQGHITFIGKQNKKD
jgi:A/G-specific adenine glycosylase